MKKINDYVGFVIILSGLTLMGLSLYAFNKDHANLAEPAVHLFFFFGGVITCIGIFTLKK